MNTKLLFAQYPIDADDCSDKSATEKQQPRHGNFHDGQRFEIVVVNQSVEEDEADYDPNQNEDASEETFIGFGAVYRVLVS